MERFVGRLAGARIGSTHNQYAQSALRRERLVHYLERRRHAPILLVGEAPGYRGTRGLRDPAHLGAAADRERPGRGHRDDRDRVLADLGIAEDVLLWNVVPTHPHRAGLPESNRPPTRREIEQSTAFVAELARGRRVVPLGRVAHRQLGGTYVRHPAQGGAAAFRAGLTASLG